MDEPLLPASGSEQEISVVRALAFANNMLEGGLRYNFVARYLGGGHEAFEQQYDEVGSTKAILFVKILLMLIFTIIAPFGYGNLIMKYPCSPENTLIGKEHQWFQKLGCETQDMIRSPWSLTLGPIAMLILWVWVKLLTRMRKFRVTSQVAMAWYKLTGLIDKRIWKLRYHKSPAICGWTADIYFILIAEMFVVSALLRSGVAVIVGLGVGEFFLLLANVVLAPSEEAIALINGKLLSWTSDAAARALLIDLSNTTSRVLALNIRDFKVFSASLSGGVLRQLLDDVNASTMVRAGEGFGFGRKHREQPVFWDSLVLQSVFIAEEDRFIAMRPTKKVSPTVLE